jgi:hypothetical protein
VVLVFLHELQRAQDSVPQSRRARLRIGTVPLLLVRSIEVARDEGRGEQTAVLGND